MSDTTNRPPSRDEVAQRLRQLISGELTPQAASDWASPWITKFLEIEPPVEPRVEKALVRLASADLLGEPEIDGALLHGQEDFEAWLREFWDTPPSRDEVAQKLRQLASGEITPQAASDWASPWIMKFDQIEPPLDPKVQVALELLNAADLLGDPDIKGALLYGQEDFEAWLQEFLD